MAFLTEPPYAHGSFARIGILLINLGTPSAPTAVAVRSYLREFLSDPRVVEIPRALWNPILHGVILRTRPQRSAARYATVWTKDGSPLQVYTARQAKLLQGVLGDRMKLPVVVEHAMRYGEPSIPTMLSRMRAAHVERLLVLPLYPQYAASTSASAVDALGGWLRRARNQPEVRVVKHFHDHPAYIAALGDSLRDFWRTRGRPDKLLMSFHGVPRFTLDRGDPYHCECQKTARLLAADLELPESAWHISFQSRFGRAEWLKPYTADTVSELARKGVRRLDVVCPGFVSDCLETLEEIALEAKALFLKSGGTEFNAIPCLNDRQGWIDALAAIVRDHLGGWGAEGWNRAAAEEAARASAARAKRLGAAT